MSQLDREHEATMRTDLEALAPAPPSMAGYATAARRRARRRQTGRLIVAGGAAAAAVAVIALGAPVALDAIRPSSADGSPAVATEPTASTPESTLTPPNCSADPAGSSSILSQMNGPGRGADTAEEAAYEQAVGLADPPFELVETAPGSVSSEWSLLREDGSVLATILVFQDGDLGWKVSSVFACGK